MIYQHISKGLKWARFLLLHYMNWVYFLTVIRSWNLSHLKHYLKYSWFIVGMITSMKFLPFSTMCAVTGGFPLECVCWYERGNLSLGVEPLPLCLSRDSQVDLEPPAPPDQTLTPRPRPSLCHPPLGSFKQVLAYKLLWYVVQSNEWSALLFGKSHCWNELRPWPVLLTRSLKSWRHGL